MKEPYWHEREGSFNILCNIFGHDFVGVDDIYHDEKTGNLYQGQPKGRCCLRCGRTEGLLTNKN